HPGPAIPPLHPARIHPPDRTPASKGTGKRSRSVTDRLIRVTTAFAVVAVAAVAALISYAHMLDLVRSHGETGATALLVPFTVDGLIWAASMVILDASRRNRPVPALAGWSLA